MDTNILNLQGVADAICDKHGYPHATIEISKRMKRAFGMCYYDRKVIRLNEKFVESNTQEVIVDLIKHEVCHLKHPNHGYGFTRACAEMGTLNHVWKQHPDCVIPDQHEWEVYCKCGYTYAFYKNTSNACQYTCPRCGTPLNWRRINNVEDTSEFNVDAVRALAKRTMLNGKKYAYPLKKIAEKVGFDTEEEYTNDDGQVKERTIIMPKEVRATIRREFPNIGFKRIDAIGGGDEVVVYMRA